MRLRVQVVTQGELESRDLGLREHQHQRDEQTVVEAALVVDAGRDAVHGQEVNDPRREGRIARRRIREVVRRLAALDGGYALLPMGAHRENGLGTAQLRPQTAHELDHGSMAGSAEYRQRPAAVGKIDDLGLLFGAAWLHGQTVLLGTMYLR